MPAVEDAELHQLVGRNILHELDADILEPWPSLRKIVLQHPLAEGFANNRRLVVEIEGLVDELDLTRAGGRCDTVDHAVRKGDIVLDIGGDVAAHLACETHHRGLGDVAVARQVVARHDGEWRQASVSPLLERGDDDAEDGFRCFRIMGIRQDLGMARIETTGLGVDKIAALRHSQ